MRAIAVAVVLVLAGCSDDPPAPGEDAASEGLPDSVPGETRVDQPGTPDSGPDGPLPDTSTDGAPDVGADGAADVGAEDAADGPAADTLAPDAVTPDTLAPDTLAPDALAPDTLAPDTLASDTLAPDTLASDTLAPDLLAPGCGNGVREGTEQCDDGNLTNLDGCDSVCRFEQCHRVNYLRMEYSTSNTCSQNAFGAAFPSPFVQGQLQNELDSGVADGSISILFKLLGLDDLAGVTDPALQVGFLTGAPEPGASYDGTSDLDWWYNADTATIDASRDPLARLDASISSSVLTAGPGKVSVTLNLVGTPATLAMSNTTVSVTNGGTSAPLGSGGTPPGHLAAENLDPALVSFAASGTSSSPGTLCGRTSAESLATIPVPDILTNCTEGYTANNSLLDVIVGGCQIIIINAVAATQPDTDDPTLPNVGAGPPYTLELDSNNAVYRCRASNNVIVNLDDCLADATYSTYLSFATGRVIIK